MPNWCSTDIIISNSDSNVLKNLESEFDKALHWNKIPNGFGEAWLGNILNYLGYTEEEIVQEKMRCRGEVTWMKMRNDGKLYINTDTAWIPMLQPFLKMIEKYAPDSELTYYAEELGCEIICTNDYEMVGKIHVCIYDDNIPDELDWLYNANEDPMNKTEFLEAVKSSIGWDIPLSEVADKIEEELPDVSWHEWEFAEIDVWK